MKKFLLILVMLVIVGGAAAWYFGRDTAQAAPLRTTKVQRDDLVATISATGTVEPEELIDIGAQVAGKILEFGKDVNGKSIDYGSEVKAGTLLARIDDSVYTAELASANAQLAEAKAGVKRAEADLVQMKAKLAQAERSWQRAQQLGISDALAQVTYDSYKAEYESAVANVAVGEASILQAQANVDQANSTLERAKRNLDYTKIYSPVDGKVIDRRVNIGQTVVASLNAPSLFLIARDLRRMQVWVAVNEADVGHIHPGQPVSFTSDAFPGEVFRGEVNKVRLNAQMTQNVVTYTVEVTTDNSSGRLLPYLTANVQFEVNRVDDTMMVPNAALRWTPKPELIAPDARQSQTQPSGSNGPTAMASAETVDRGPARTASGGGPGAGGPGGGRRRRGGDVARQEGSLRPETIWVKEGQYVRPVSVMAGLTDGTNTQVVSDQLKEGAEVVTGEIIAFATGNQQTNPFAPPSMRGGQRGQGGGRGGPGGGGGGGGRGGGGRGG